jgi:hypothetical protein
MASRPSDVRGTISVGACRQQGQDAVGDRQVIGRDDIVYSAHDPVDRLADVSIDRSPMICEHNATFTGEKNVENSHRCELHDRLQGIANEGSARRLTITHIVG